MPWLCCFIELLKTFFVFLVQKNERARLSGFIYRTLLQVISIQYFSKHRAIKNNAKALASKNAL
jgi:hypothetical protein